MDWERLAEHLRSHVERLARTPRTPGTRAHQEAAQYIREQLQGAGFLVQEEPFDEAGFEGTNLVTQPIPDRPDLPLFIVGAHYDTKPATPGADDNASGVAALLELAKWIHTSQASFAQARCRLQLAAYDLEEAGLIGSWVQARALQRSGQAVQGMISLEMLGYTDQQPGSQGLPPHLARLYPDVGNFIGVCGNVASQALLQVVAESMKSIPGLPVEFIAVPGTGEALPEVRLSDHSSFWDFGYPALMITDTSFFRNPHYHRASDTAETLDYPFLARVTAGVCQAVGRLWLG